MTDPSPTPAEPQPYSAEEMPKVLAELRRPSLGNIRHLEVGPEDGLRLAATLSSLLEDQKRLQQALGFYADPENWGEDDWGVRSIVQPPEYGQPGTIARVALDAARTPLQQKDR